MLNILIAEANALKMTRDGLEALFFATTTTSSSPQTTPNVPASPVHALRVLHLNKNPVLTSKNVLSSLHPPPASRTSNARHPAPPAHSRPGQSRPQQLCDLCTHRHR